VKLIVRRSRQHPLKSIHHFELMMVADVFRMAGPKFEERGASTVEIIDYH
jgi:hypothetical protein